MMKNFQIFSIAMAVALLLTACGSSPTPTPTTVSATETSKPSETPTMTATASPTPTQTLTPTPLPPMVVVGGAVPCYLEWNTDSPLVTTFNVKTKIQVLAKNGDGAFLMVGVPESDSSCWLEAQYVTWIASSAEQLAAIFPTVTSTPLLPEKVLNVKTLSQCDDVRKTSGNVVRHTYYASILLSWDAVPDAEGYRIYKDGEFFATLDKFKNNFTDSWQTSSPDSGQHIYGIQVFNSTGESLISEYAVSYTCKGKG